MISNYIQKLVVYFSIILLSACTQSYTKSIVREFIGQSSDASTRHSVRRTSDWVMSVSTKITVAQTTHSHWSTLKNYNRAHHSLNQSLKDEFAHVFPFTRVIETSSFEQALSSAKLLSSLGQSDVLIIPQILVFEDNLNSFAEINEGTNIHPGKKVKSDSIQVQLSVYQSYDGQLIDVVRIESSKGVARKSKQSPDALFTPDISEYLQRIVPSVQAPRFSLR